MKVRLKQYSDRQSQAETLANEISTQLVSILQNQPRVTLALAGGQTPMALYRALADCELDWQRVDVLLTDERWVPERDAKSNLAMLKACLTNGYAKEVCLHPFYRAVPDPDSIIETLHAAIVPCLPLDVCVLGMGEDGHIASLFPNADRLDEALSPACASSLIPMRVPGIDEIRLSLTAPVIQAASAIHLLICGKPKLAALNAAQELSAVNKVPVRLVLDLGKTTVHYAP